VANYVIQADGLWPTNLTSVKHVSRIAAHHGLIYPRKPMMTTQLTAPFKKQLLEQREDLLEQLRNLRGGTVGRAEASAEHFGHPEDSTAQVNSARDLEFAMDERETTELRLIDAALARIEAGTYGQCIDCGVSIPAARLHAAPEAARCISCQEKVE
jgi:DnaK suppressor protein